MTRDLRGLAKAHLHLHVEGAMRIDTLSELANKYRLPPPPAADGSFGTFLKQYGMACEVLRSVDDFRRLVDEIVEDAATDGAVYLEPAYWSNAEKLARMGLRHTEEVTEILLDALGQAAAKHNVSVGLMISGDRVRPASQAEDLATMAARYAGKGVVSFGLAGDEAAGPPAPFDKAFSIARAAGLIPAPHAGEHGGPDSVRGALDVLGARRIAHGVRSVEDPRLLERLVQEDVCLDVCPTSNVHLKVCRRIEEHPLPMLLAAGVPVSLNADDPTFFGSGLLQEYELARSVFGLDDGALANIAATSIRASGAPEALKTHAQQQIQRWLSAPAPQAVSS
jgi:adenosine deaminase